MLEGKSCYYLLVTYILSNTRRVKYVILYTGHRMLVQVQVQDRDQDQDESNQDRIRQPDTRDRGQMTGPGPDSRIQDTGSQQQKHVHLAGQDQIHLTQAAGTGTDQWERQNIYREQDSQQLVDSTDQSRNLVTWNVKQKQAWGLVKRNSFPHWGIRLNISV